MTGDDPCLRVCLDRLVGRLGVPASGAGIIAVGRAPVLAVDGQRRRDRPGPITFEESEVGERVLVAIRATYPFRFVSGMIPIGPLTLSATGRVPR